MVNNGCERDRDNSCKVVSILCMIGDESTSKPGKHVAAMAAMSQEQSLRGHCGLHDAGGAGQSAPR